MALLLVLSNLQSELQYDGEWHTCVSDRGVRATSVVEEHRRSDLDVGAEDLGEDVSDIARLQLLDCSCLVEHQQECLLTPPCIPHLGIFQGDTDRKYSQRCRILALF